MKYFVSVFIAAHVSHAISIDSWSGFQSLIIFYEKNFSLWSPYACMSAANEASSSIHIFISQASREKWTILACILKCASARIAWKLIFDLWTNKHNRTSLIWLPLWALNESDAKWEKVGVYFMFSFAVYKCSWVPTVWITLDYWCGFMWQCVALRLAQGSFKTL